MACSGAASGRPARVGDRRAMLLLTTALYAAFASLPAAADPAPNARPQGGSVTAGSATIAQGLTTTTITQTSPRAVIDWQGFDVGSQQTVKFAQPGPTATVLNRVNSGEPSQIAGRISANGQVIIENRSGMIFTEGAQVDARALVATAAGIGTARFMAGGTKFDVPANAGAAVVNRGRITVAETGLAALVAPNVSNSGVITAKAGRVVLAGATTHTVDLYGDGLLSIDVGASGTVSNSGTIRAEGGRVLMSAAAADGIVTGLVEAGGRIAVDGRRGGGIEVRSTGGSVIVSGTLSATGRAQGGAVVVVGSTSTKLAAGGRIDASGGTGGRVAVGRSGGQTSARTEIAAGATVSADGGRKGKGGSVTVMSTQSTTVAGRITATGGQGGGTVEVSGLGALTLTGVVDVGVTGTLLIDPQDLVILAGGADGGALHGAGGDGTIAAGDLGGASATIDPAVFQNLTGNVVLQASRDLSVLSTVASVARTLSLEAGRNLTVAAPVTLAGGGTIALSAAVAGFAGTPGYDAAGPLGLLRIAPSGSAVALNGNVALHSAAGGVQVAGAILAGSVSADVTAGGTLSVSSAVIAGSARFSAGEIALSGLVRAAGTLTLVADGAVTSVGTLAAGLLTGSAARVRVSGGGNSVGAIGAFATDGDFSLQSNGNLKVIGPLAAGGVAAPSPANTAEIDLIVNGGLAIGQPGIVGSINAGTVKLLANGAISEPLGFIFANVLRGPSPGEAIPQALSVNLTGLNSITQLGAFTTLGDLKISSQRDVTVIGTLFAGGVLGVLASNSATVELSSNGNLTLGQVGAPVLVNGGTVALLAAGTISEANGVILTSRLSGPAPGLAISQAAAVQLGGANSIRSIGDFVVAGDFLLNDFASLTLAGTLSAGTLPAPDVRNTTQVALQTSGNLTIGGSAGHAVLNGGTVMLLANGTISEPDGAIGANLLRGGLIGSAPVVSGGVTLEGTNTLARLEDFATVGDFLLVNGAALTVAGTISAGGVAAPSASNGATLLILARDDLVLGAPGVSTLLNAGTVSLSAANGSVSEPNGAITANRFVDLVSAGANSLQLTGANSINEIGAFSARGDLAINDTLPMAVIGRVSAGGVTAPNAANTGALTLTSGGAITLGRAGAPAVLNGGTVTVLATGALSAPNGVITANLLNGPAGPGTTSVSLPGANAVAALGSFVSAGDFILTTTTDLAVVGAVSAGGGAGGAARLALQSARNLVVGGPGAPAVLSGGTVQLLAGGTISEPNGVIDAGLLIGPAPGRAIGSAASVTLDAPGNTIGRLGDFVSARDFVLADSGPLLVAGSLIAGGTLGLTALGSIVLGDAGTPALLTAGSVALVSSGMISEPNGVIIADFLAGPHPGAAIGAASAITLTGANRIKALGGMTATGDIALVDTVRVQLLGTLSAGGMPAPDPANTSRIDLTLGGGVSIGSASIPGASSAGTLALASVGSVAAPNGSVSANVLTTAGSSVSGLSLPGANRIATIDSLTVTDTDLVLRDTVPLTIRGVIATQAGNAQIDADAGLALLPGGVISAINLTIASSAGGVSLSSGAALIANDLSLSITAAGDLRLDGAVTQVGTILHGPVGSPQPTGTIVLASLGGSVAQSGSGTIRAKRGSAMDVSAQGAVVLDGPGNSVTNLGSATIGGSFRFDDTTQLTITGNVTTGGGVALNSNGDITQASGVMSAATGAVRITAAGAAFNQSGGASIVAPSDAVGIVGDTHITIGGAIIAGTTLDLTSPRGQVSEVSQIGLAGITSGNIAATVLTVRGGLGIGLVPQAGGNSVLATTSLDAGRGPLGLSSLTSLTIGGDATGTGGIAISSRGDLAIASGVKVVSSGTADTVALTAGRNLSAFPGSTISGARTILQAPGFIGLSGLVDGVYISIGGPSAAGAQQVALTDGAVLQAGAAGVDYGLAMPLAAWPGSATATQGAFIASRSLSLSGTTTIVPRTDTARSPTSGRQEPTLRVDIGSGGIFNATGGLSATTTTLFVNLGAGASASGRLQLGNLYLAYVRSAPGTAEFTGTIRAIGGQAAAQVSSISPAQNAFYRINACPLASVSCFVVSTERIPQSNPIQDLDIRPARDSIDETDVLLPNVSGRDF